MYAQSIKKGVIFATLAAVSFTVMSLFGKITSDRASTDTLLFARFLISLILLLPWALKNIKKILFVSNPIPLVVRSLFTLLAFACFFYALQFISLSSALLLNNTFPLFIPIIAWFMARLHTPYKVWLGIILGFIGVGIVLKPESNFFQFASIIALASGILAAVAIVIIRRLTKTTPVVQILFYNFMICSLITGFFLPFGWQPITIETCFLLLGVGFFGAVYQLFSTLSYANAPVRITSSLMFLSIFFGIIVDWLSWDKTLDMLTLIGMLCVVFGGIMTIYFGQKEIIHK